MNNSKQEILSQSIKDNRIVPMTIQGDSMQPEYYDSDIVLVDTEYKNPVGGGEFFIAGENLGAKVIRAEHGVNGIEILYSNPLYNSYTMGYNEFASVVVGRVVGHIQSMLLTDAKCEPTIMTKQLRAWVIYQWSIRS